MVATMRIWTENPSFFNKKVTNNLFISLLLVLQVQRGTTVYAQWFEEPVFTPRNFTIAIVPKTTPSPFYDLIVAGCQDLATLISQHSRHDHVNCIVRGTRELNATAQSMVIDELVLLGQTTGEIDALAVAAVDGAITGRAIDRAMAAGIPVITVDSDAPNSKRIVSIGTNDFEIGHGLAWLLAAARPWGGRYSVISSNAMNVQHRVDGLRFKLQRSFPMTPWNEYRDATDCQDNIELALDQAFVLGDDPQVDAIVTVGGWPMFNPVRWRQFVDRYPHKYILAVDSLPVQMDLLQDGYADALIGQLPYDMGQRSADTLYSILSDSIFTAPTEIVTDVEIFMGHRQQQPHQTVPNDRTAGSFASTLASPCKTFVLCMTGFHIMTGSSRFF